MFNLDDWLKKASVHRSQASESGTDSETSKAHFCNWSVDDALLAELVQQAFGDLRKIE